MIALLSQALGMWIGGGIALAIFFVVYLLTRKGK